MAEKLPVPESVQQTEQNPSLMEKKVKEELIQLAPEEKPLVNLDDIRRKSSGQYKEIAEFDDGTVMRFVFNKMIPYEVQEKMYDDKVLQVDSKGEMEVNLKLWSRIMWKHLVASVSPHVDETELRTLPNEFSSQVIGFVFEKWQENQVDVPQLKKNSKRTSKKR